MADVYGARCNRSTSWRKPRRWRGGDWRRGGRLFPDFDVIHRFVRVDQTATPGAENQRLYAKLMPIFEKTYRSLVEVYDELEKLSS